VAFLWLEKYNLQAFAFPLIACIMTLCHTLIMARRTGRYAEEKTLN
jgi:hypothetical protein